jgi:hypothetical protein
MPNGARWWWKTRASSPKRGVDILKMEFPLDCIERAG